MISTNFSGYEVNEILLAIDFALKAHAKKKQMRAYLDLPYIVHPMEVVRELISLGADMPSLLAGALHDVLEDTDVTPDELRQRFGEEVTRLVQEVTNPKRGIGQNRKEWLVLVYNHLAHASSKAQNIKCTDIGANIGTGETAIAELDPDKAKTYIPEKVIALEHLTCADPVYKEFARERIQEGLNRLAPTKVHAARI